MAHKSWESASEWRNVKKRPYWSIKSPAQLVGMTIRELKQLAAQMNEQLGTVIAKPLSRRLLQGKGGKGKTLGEMKKLDLIECIWAVRKVQLSRPVAKGQWELFQFSPRVFQFSAPTGEAWVHYVGFHTEQQAYKQYQYMMDAGLCELAAMRKGDRTGYAWEVKYWGIDSSALQSLIKRDLREPEPIAAVVEENRVWDIPTRIQNYTTIITNAGKAGLIHVRNQLSKHPEWGLSLSPQGEVVMA